MTFKHFSPETDPKINWDKVDMPTLQMLDNARDIAGVPFVITSNYRDPAHSVEVGGGKSDAHTEIPTTAFDIACHDSSARLKIIQGLIKAGFTRMGLNLVHIHADNSKLLPQNVFWLE
jgi:hypothetical protein